MMAKRAMMVKREAVKIVKMMMSMIKKIVMMVKREAVKIVKMMMSMIKKIVMIVMIIMTAKQITQIPLIIQNRAL